MNIMNFKEVIHISDEKEVTKYLNNGWFIIDTFTKVSDPSTPKDTILIYSLGRL